MEDNFGFKFAKANILIFESFIFRITLRYK